MKKALILFFLLCSVFITSAQSHRRIASMIERQKQIGASFKLEDRLFSHFDVPADLSAIVANTVKAFEIVQFDKSVATTLLSEHPKNLDLKIPVNADSSVLIELTESSFLTPDFSVHTASAGTVNYHGGIHYWGIILGDPASLCSFSIYEDEVMGFISSPRLGNFVVGKLNGLDQGYHIIYNDKDFVHKPAFECFDTNDGGSYLPEQLQTPTVQSVNCIRIYWEINYDIFLGKGGVTNATNYALAVFNESATLYTNDNIPVELSQIYVWDVPSPYTQTSTSGLLNQFQSYRNSFPGDLGSLLGYDGGGGVAASISGLCSPNLDYSQCYSMLTGSYNTVPTYSWDVEVVTHEQGHLMGSRHTHACVWNGNSTAIDGCGPAAGYPYEGSCSGAPIPSSGGTIMSYCHLTSAGINFSLGFGSQPANVILNNYTSASCLSACTGGTFCGATSGLLSSSVSTSTAQLSWSPAPGAVQYRIQYRISGSSTWIIDSTASTSYLASGLTPGSTYEWQIQTVCSANSASFSSFEYFITIPLVCSDPVGMITTNITSIGADISWTAAPAAIGYNIQYRVVGTSTWTTATTSTNSYHISGLTPITAYEWQVQTICAGNGTSSFTASSNFVTQEAGAPVTITLQPDSVCGKDAVIGSNIPTNSNITNFGNDPEFDVLGWTISGASANLRSLLEFDLSFIPQGSAIQSANLSLYWNPTSVNAGHSTLSGSNSSTLNKITSPWSEYGVTWVNQPPTTTVHQVALAASTSSTQDYLNLDVKDMIQDFVDDPLTNYGMMLKLDNETPYRSLTFASSDHLNPSLRPKLELTYLPNIAECASYQYSSCYGTDAVIGNCVPAGYVNQNFGFNPEFDAISWTYTGVQSEFRGLIYWDLSAIPSNAVVNSATVTLYWNPTSVNPGHSTMSGSNDAYFQKVTSPWTEDAVTWATQPTVDTTNEVYMPMSTSSQQDYAIDVTGLVQGMVTNPATNYGMMLRLVTESYYRSLIFCSSDHADPARHPKIEVCYSIPNNVNQISQKENIKVKYDHNSGTLILEAEKDFESGTAVSLLNCIGQEVVSVSNPKANLIVIDVSKLSTGVYFYRINSIKNILSGKVFIGSLNR